jgi:acyl-CoA synthetase (AMP-forming)/AMP-acid ligase II
LAKEKYQTLLEVLERRAAETPGKVAFTFHKDPPCTYGHLWKQVTQSAAYLLHRGLKPQDRVLIAIFNSSEFFFIFYGAQRAGGISVPVFPGSGSERILKLADLCDARFIVISKNLPAEKITELSQGSRRTGRLLLFMEDGFLSRGQALFPGILPEHISFIQFTSGSTGNPKGVQLSHADLIVNIEQMTAGLEITTSDYFVNWLPVYHDMGLILMTMVPFYLGIEFVLVPMGLNYIKTWLKTIEEREATFTAAPDFAYRLCLLYIRDPRNYNLSGLRVALNAAEPVRYSTITDFENKFNLKNVMLPAYGLAEATVGVCGWSPGQKVKVDQRGFVSVGTPFPGVKMRVVSDGKPAKPGEVGEILVWSKATTIGYFRNAPETEALFTEEGYIRTGDSGYCDDEGHYYIVGRKKSIIIQGGYNISAREVEELVDKFPFVRRSAAVGIDRGKTEGEQVYIFIEVKLDRSQLESEKKRVDMVIDVVQRFARTFGFRPGRVFLLRPRAIPMTPNGKIKYLLLKQQYLEKSLQEKGLIIFP